MSRSPTGRKCGNTFDGQKKPHVHSTLELYSWLCMAVEFHTRECAECGGRQSTYLVLSCSRRGRGRGARASEGQRARSLLQRPRCALALPLTVCYEIRCGPHRCSLSSTGGYESVFTPSHMVAAQPLFFPHSTSSYLVDRDFAKGATVRCSPFAVRCISQFGTVQQGADSLS